MRGPTAIYMLRFLALIGATVSGSADDTEYYPVATNTLENSGCLVKRTRQYSYQLSNPPNDRVAEINIAPELESLAQLHAMFKQFNFIATAETITGSKLSDVLIFSRPFRLSLDEDSYNKTEADEIFAEEDRILQSLPNSDIKLHDGLVISRGPDEMSSSCLFDASIIWQQRCRVTLEKVIEENYQVKPIEESNYNKILVAGVERSNFVWLPLSYTDNRI